MSDSTSRESAGAGAEGIWPWKRTGKTATSPATGISTGSARRDYRVRGQPMRRSGTGGVELHDRWMRAGRLLARRDETGSSGDRARTAAGRRAAAQYESRRSKWQCALQAKGTSRDVRRCRRGTMRFRLAAPRGAVSPDSANRAAAPEGAEGIGSGREAGAASLPDAPPRCGCSEQLGRGGRFYDAPGSWARAYSRGADPKTAPTCSANASSLMIGVAPW